MKLFFEDDNEQSTSNLEEFNYAFAVNRMTIFEVRYYTLGSNSHPYFATSADVFNRPKTDWSTCGQCQDRVLSGKAMEFYRKWDFLHTKDLTEEQYNEIRNDIEELKRAYPHYIEKLGREARYNISFWAERELSMEFPRR